MRRIVTLCAVFLLSGASALIFEALWFHQAGLALGNSVWASSLVLTGFMAGIAIGNAVAARIGDQSRRPVRAYALLELTIASAGVGLVTLLPEVGGPLAGVLRPLEGTPIALNAARFVIALVLLLVPSSAMGATLPLLMRALSAEPARYGARLGLLYGCNTLGALTGVLAAELWLIERFGIVGSALVAAAMNAIAASGAIWLSIRSKAQESHTAELARPPDGDRRAWLLTAFSCGFVLLALEVVWVRLLLQFLSGEASAFAWMLAAVLGGIAVGGFVGAAWLRRDATAHRHTSTLTFLAGATTIAAYAALPGIVERIGIEPITERFDILMLGSVLMAPTSLVSGVLFALNGAGLRLAMRSEASTTGVLTMSNTLGAALGSLAGAFVLLPTLGVEGSLFALALAYGLVGVVLLATRALRHSVGYVAAALCVAAIALFPFGQLYQRLMMVPLGRYMRSAEDRVVAIREGLTETSAYIEHRVMGSLVYWRLVTNGYSMTGTSQSAQRYMKLYVYWPAAVHESLRDALLISYGAGMTAKALVDTSSLEHIDVVDLSRDILELSDIPYPTPGTRPLEDPRVDVHVEDGRSFLLSTTRKYDLITAEPPPPRMAGVVNLYTREFFQLAHDRLRAGGIVTYWLPMHSLSDRAGLSILRAFCDAFSDCSLWHGSQRDLMMVGTRDRKRATELEHFAQQWRDPRTASTLRELGIESPALLGALFIGDADYLEKLTAGSEPLVDDHPRRVVAPPSSAARERALLDEWNDAVAARDRFQRSALIRDLWPRSLTRDTLPEFETQASINRIESQRTDALRPPLSEVHRYLVGSRLETLVLWLLGGDVAFARIFERLEGAQRNDAVVLHHLASARIARRDFAGALVELERAAALSAQPHPGSALLHAYVLCRLERWTDAERVLRSSTGPLMSDAGYRAQLDWMLKTFPALGRP